MKNDINQNILDDSSKSISLRESLLVTIIIPIFLALITIIIVGFEYYFRIYHNISYLGVKTKASTANVFALIIPGASAFDIFGLVIAFIIFKSKNAKRRDKLFSGISLIFNLAVLIILGFVFYKFY